MKTVIAIILVVVTLGASEPPRFRASDRQRVPSQQSSAPYNPRGWQPQGASFTLPKLQPQQSYGAPNPVPSYGPPPQEPTTTESGAEVLSTDPPHRAKISSKERNSKISDVVKQSQESYFVVLPQNAVVLSQPQSQNLVYTVAQVEKSSPFVDVPRATIVAAPLTLAQLQTLPVSRYKSVYSPLTASYVEPSNTGFLVSS